MWMMPCKRPHLLERVFGTVKPSEHGVILVNELEIKSPKYKDRKLPSGWKFHVVDGCDFYRDRVNAAFDAFPDEDYYGLINDDHVPETPDWDKMLGERAGNNRVASAHQVFFKDRVGAHAIGGDLVRECGWLCCPAVKHFYSDDVLELIINEFNCHTKYDEIRVAHHHFSVGKAPYDEVYKKRSDGDDKGAFETWKKNEWPALRERLKPLYV